MKAVQCNNRPAAAPSPLFSGRLWFDHTSFDPVPQGRSGPRKLMKITWVRSQTVRSGEVEFISGEVEAATLSDPERAW